MITKKDNLFFSKIILKFINTLIYIKIKQKIQNMLNYSFYYWKKLLGTVSIFYLFESLLKLRPLVGFYIYVTKRKKKKHIKIKPYFMNFKNRWLKAIFWFSRSLKMNASKNTFYINFINELYMIVFLEKGDSFNQKTKYYKTILSFKTSKNFKW